jgi:hypothetical protein
MPAAPVAQRDPDGDDRLILPVRDAAPPPAAQQLPRCNHTIKFTSCLRRALLSSLARQQWQGVQHRPAEPDTALAAISLPLAVPMQEAAQKFTIRQRASEFVFLHARSGRALCDKARGK